VLQVFFAPPLYGSYAATKYAVEALSDTMRMEFPFPVILFEPGSFQSEMITKLKGNIPITSQKESNLKRYIRILHDQGSKSPPLTTVVDHLEYALLAIVPPARLLIGNDAIALNLLVSVIPDSILTLLYKLVIF